MLKQLHSQHTVGADLAPILNSPKDTLSDNSASLEHSEHSASTSPLTTTSISSSSSMTAGSSSSTHTGSEAHNSGKRVWTRLVASSSPVPPSLSSPLPATQAMSDTVDSTASRRSLKSSEHVPSGVRIVSLLEGLPTQLSSVFPRLMIVPLQSAYPGFGESLTLAEDHISICKPSSKAHPAYLVVEDALRTMLAEKRGPPVTAQRQ